MFLQKWIIIPVFCKSHFPTTKRTNCFHYIISNSDSGGFQNTEGNMNETEDPIVEDQECLKSVKGCWGHFHHIFIVELNFITIHYGWKWMYTMWHIYSLNSQRVTTFILNFLLFAKWVHRIFFCFFLVCTGYRHTGTLTSIIQRSSVLRTAQDSKF